MSVQRLVRTPRPRRCGLTMMIDPGLPTGFFTDVVASHSDHIDLVKFGWGTALVTRDIERKIAVLREHRIAHYFGGTLFERYAWTGRLAEYVAMLRDCGATHVEVSNGTVPMDNRTKARHVARLAVEFTVLSEVGFKDPARSACLSPQDWVSAIREDLAAGAWLAVTETRESGRSGIADCDGRLRRDVLDAVLCAVPPSRIMFEAPTKELQVELVQAIGPDVNVGNVAAADVIGMETLRLGLRADTLLDAVEREAVGAGDAAVAQAAPSLSAA